ncbi:hypothetical protein DEI92_02850 [Curtobacterium sp. MCBD17_034]|nr:hypothetical protein DEI92_02850 [Curtobacterium sp. MCBD17_034]PZM39854.1 hypothetical protein DEI90_03255 [Curtobacterium sp. MCBD17_031]
MENVGTRPFVGQHLLMLEVLRVDARTPDDVARSRQRAASDARGAPVREGLLRLATGAYVRRDDWEAADRRTRHIARIAAIAPLIREGRVVAHRSAAALHGWPVLDGWPSQVDLAERGRVRLDRRARSVALHPMTAEAHELREALGALVPVHDPAVVAADIARAATFPEAVVMLDHAVRSGVDRQRAEELASGAGARGAARARRAFAFADGRSESVGESLTRVVLHELGAPPPVLQHEFHAPDGALARVDFWFPDQGVVVEFDGEVKYRDRAMRAGRDLEQVVIDEKYREDWVRAVPEVHSFVRVRWAQLFRRAALAAVFRRAGLPLAA